MKTYKKILITGADGFIGSHLCELLIKKKFNVTAISFYNSFGSNGWLDYINKDNRKKIKIISGDIRDKDFVSSIVKGQNVSFYYYYKF